MIDKINFRVSVIGNSWIHWKGVKVCGVNIWVPGDVSVNGNFWASGNGLI